MRIGIELRYIVLGQSDGVAQLLKGVLEHAISQATGDSFALFCTVFNRTLLNIEESDRVTVHTLPLHTYFSEVDRLCAEKGVDVLFRGYPSEDTLTFPISRQIFQIPDLQHEKYPEFLTSEVLSSRCAAFIKALRGAGAIGTVSEFVKRAIIQSPRTRCKDIFLMPPALQEDHQGVGLEECTAEELAMIPDRPYFVFPADFWPHKNHRGLIEGFRNFLETTKRDYDLVLTGHPAGWAEMLESYAGLPIHHLGKVRPPLMRLLLERSLALTFFSLYEGFGMPLLEAFNAGTSVLCSNSTSLPEIGENAVLTCNPEDSKAIAALMVRLVDEPGLRDTLVERGRHRLAIYDWSKSAINLINACHRVHVKIGTSSAVISTLEADSFLACDEPNSLAVDSHPAAFNAPLVSIVTPSYNQGNYLRRTIESVLTQSYLNIELIVIDGGSSDDSVDILKEYGNRISWVSERDHGQTHAINKGMKRARGEILAYLNSDDVLMAGAVDKVVRHFAEHVSAMLVYGKAFYIDQEDRIIGEYKTEKYSSERLAQECIICQPATFWRRQLLDLIGEFDESLNYTMDYDYWLRAAKSGARIDFLEEHLASSRLYPETKTLAARRKIYREIFQICWEHNRYIGRDYFIGYWHHVLHERASWLTRLGALLPYGYVGLGYLHYMYVSHWKRSKETFIRHIMNKQKVGMRRHVPAIARAKSAVHSLPVRTQVCGFHVDNWVESRLRISRPKRELGSVSYLQGVSPVQQRVEIRVDGKVVSAKKLAEGSRERIELLLPNEDISLLEFVFSAHAMSLCSRKLAFSVEATNLFSEQDLQG